MPLARVRLGCAPQPMIRRIRSMHALNGSFPIISSTCPRPAETFALLSVAISRATCSPSAAAARAKRGVLRPTGLDHSEPWLRRGRGRCSECSQIWADFLPTASSPAISFSINSASDAASQPSLTWINAHPSVVMSSVSLARTFLR